MAYLFFGALSTIVNYGFYMTCSNVGLPAIASNAVAWIAAVVFAFVTNKIFVFHSKSWRSGDLLPEVGKFLSCRIASGVMETAFLWITVDMLNLSNFVMKIIASIAVVIANYFASKFLIFKKRGISNA